MKAQLSGPMWLVAGRRPTPTGLEELVASAWGKTETGARAFYQRLQDLAEQQRLPGSPAGPRWLDEQLTFVRVPEVAS